MEPTPDLCPACKATLPDTGQFPAWCPACNWNVEIVHSIVEWKHSALDKLIFRVRARHAEKQYEDLIAREPHSLASRWTAGKIATYALAAVVTCCPLC